MLLYIDKKKEKRRKIIICCIILFSVFLCYANISHFKTNIHQANKLLSATKISKKSNTWFQKSNTIILFEKPNNSTEKIILIPKKFNKENALTLALAFSKLKQPNYKISYSSEVSFTKEINKIASVFFSNTTSENSIQITTELKNIKQKIIEETFLPTSLSYKHAEKLKKNQNLMETLNRLFPPHQKINDKLEKEQKYLKEFIKKYGSELKKLLISNEQPIFTQQHFFLNSAHLCIKTNKRLLCSANNNFSLEYNLRVLQKQIPQEEAIISLFLLTSEQEISEQEANAPAENDGLHFNFHNHNIYMIEKTKTQLTKKKENSYILKQQAGFNPLYFSPEMHFYKFKYVEVKLNDDI